MCIESKRNQNEKREKDEELKQSFFSLSRIIKENQKVFSTNSKN